MGIVLTAMHIYIKTGETIVKKTILVVTAAIMTLTLTACSESMKRDMKDHQSEYNGGLERTVDVIQSGKVIKHYEGKFDIQKTAGKVKFIDQNNKSHIVYIGNDTTVITDEK